MEYSGREEEVEEMMIGGQEERNVRRSRKENRAGQDKELNIMKGKGEVLKRGEQEERNEKRRAWQRNEKRRLRRKQEKGRKMRG